MGFFLNNTEIERESQEISKSKIFFKNPALSLFYLYSPLTSCKKITKILGAVSEKTALPTNQPTNQVLPTTPILQELADVNPTKHSVKSWDMTVIITAVIFCDLTEWCFSCNKQNKLLSSHTTSLAL